MSGILGDFARDEPEPYECRARLPPIAITDARIGRLVERVDELDSRVKDVASAVENQAVQNRDLWVKLRQGLLLAAKFIEKVHIRMERYK